MMTRPRSLCEREAHITPLGMQRWTPSLDLSGYYSISVGEITINQPTDQPSQFDQTPFSNQPIYPSLSCGVLNTIPQPPS
jgi:hypothetical protein